MNNLIGRPWLRMIRMGLLLMLVTLAVAWAGISEAEAASGRYRMEAEFEYLPNADRSAAVPTVTVHKTNLDNGNLDNQTYTFPESGIKVPENTDYYMEDGDKSGKPYTFYPTACGYSYGTYTLSASSGDKAYNVYCDITRKNNDPQAATFNFRLYEFDFNTHKLSLLQNLKSQKRYSMIELFPEFGGYAVYPDGLAYEHPYNTRTTSIYSFNGNKLLAKINGSPRQDDNTPALSNPKSITYKEYTRLTDNKKDFHAIAMNQIPNTSYVSSSAGNFKEELYELLPNGTKQKVKGYSDAVRTLWKKKIGSITYAHYYQKGTTRPMVGTVKGNSYTPLNLSNTKAYGTFTPDLAYLILTETPVKLAAGSKGAQYSTAVIDTKTGKLVYRLPAYYPASPEHLYQFAGNNIASLHFRNNQLDGYLHVPSGLVTRVTQYTDYENPSSYILTGDKNNLISYKTPPQLFIDGKQAAYKGQGPFLTDKYVWYMSVSDYASAVQATITRGSGSTILTRGKYTLKLQDQDKSLLKIGGSNYAPMESMNNGLGIAAAFHEHRYVYGKKNTYDRIVMFSRDFSEEQFHAAFPDAGHPEKYTDMTTYTMSGNAPVAGNSEEEHTYEVYDKIHLIFEGGKLTAAGFGTPRLTKPLRDVMINDGKPNAIVTAYGAPKVYNSGDKVLRTYSLPYSTLLFQSSGNTINGMFYIFK